MKPRESKNSSLTHKIPINQFGGGIYYVIINQFELIQIELTPPIMKENIVERKPLHYIQNEEKIETVGDIKEVNTIEDYFNRINNKNFYKKETHEFKGIKSLPKDYIHDEKIIKRKKVPKRHKERADSIESIFKYIRYVTGKKRYSLRIRRKGEELIYKNFELASEAIKVRNSIIKNSDSW